MTALDPSLTDPEKSREDVDSALDTLDAAQTDEDDPRAQVLVASKVSKAESTSSLLFSGSVKLGSKAVIVLAVSVSA
jgi:hypothetical protein